MLFVFLVVAAIVMVWLLLMVGGWLSLRGSRRSPERHTTRRLLLAMIPILLGFFLLNFHLRFSTNGAVSNLSWPFVVPIGLGIVALVAWFRARQSVRPPV